MGPIYLFYVFAVYIMIWPGKQFQGFLFIVMYCLDKLVRGGGMLLAVYYIGFLLFKFLLN